MMNIHKEMAIYKILVLRSSEALQRMNDAKSDAQENGDDTGNSFRVLAESSIFCALDQLARSKCNEICDAFEKKDQKTND